MSDEEKKEAEAPQTEAPQAEASQAEAPTEKAAETVQDAGPEPVEGKVKWFSNVKGFGFLTAEGNDKDVFVHYSSIQGDGYKTLNEAEEVTFQLIDSDKGPQAANVMRKKKQKDEKAE